MAINYGDNTPVNASDISDLLNPNDAGVSFGNEVQMEIVIRLYKPAPLNSLDISVANVKSFDYSIDGYASRQVRTSIFDGLPLDTY